ncbi:extracellular solute-binding protein [Actinoplanes subtropicus]|uniref:extracellular solute-binding protein n=1 Tax=Actinoplanes subtropicus TaxID=543632 RepID=UPI000B07DF82|nr:extracellular solute-binding protein [Actinoplanes subtropicus]
MTLVDGRRSFRTKVSGCLGEPAACGGRGRDPQLPHLRPWAAQLPDSFETVAQYQGKTYNALFGLNGIGAVHNDDAMKKAGLTAPGTWTDLLAFCKAAAAKGTPAYALGIQDNWVTQLVLYALVATTVFGPDKDFATKMADGQATFANSPWTTAMAKYQEMSKAGCFQKNPLGTSYEAGQTLAAAGRTLGIVQGNWVISLLKGKNASGHFTMKALPATDDPAGFLMPAAAGAGYGVNAKAKNKDLALKFITFVMSPEGMKTFNEAQGSLPTLAGAGTPVDPGLAELTTYVKDNKTVPFMDQLWPNAKVQQTMLSGLQEIFSNQSTPDKGPLRHGPGLQGQLLTSRPGRPRSGAARDAARNFLDRSRTVSRRGVSDFDSGQSVGACFGRGYAVGCG